MQESKSKSVALSRQSNVVATPALIEAAGQAAAFAWEEFFQGQIRNKHTRTAYERAVRRFLQWSDLEKLDVARITPGMVGRYFDQLPISVPSKKLHLAAIRSFFDVMVQRHVIIINPAHSVRVERYVVVEGRTPAIAVVQARALLKSIALDSPIDLRDRALIAVLIYTAARAGAVAKLRIQDFTQDGSQFVLRFAEKGGKVRSIPVRHDLQESLEAYLLVARQPGESKDAPLFRSAASKGKRISMKPMSGVDVCRVVKRRVAAAGLPNGISPHSFRTCTATDLLSQGVPLDDVQYLLGHSDARTTRLYDRRQKQVTRNVVERISV